MSLVSTGSQVLLACVLGAGVLYGAYHHGVAVTDDRWQRVIADQQVLRAKGLAAATTANRAEELRRQSAINEVARDAKQQREAAAADASAADAAGERVRGQAGKLAAGASCSPGDSRATRRSEAATRASMVLSDLFQRADKRAGELAKYYDSARVAGLACEAAYSRITQ